MSKQSDSWMDFPFGDADIIEFFQELHDDDRK